MCELYCHVCMQFKKESEFSIWLDKKKGAKRCDNCQDSEYVHKIIIQQEKERKLKRQNGELGLTQSQIGYSKSPSSQEKLRVRREIEFRRDLMQIKDDIGL